MYWLVRKRCQMQISGSSGVANAQVVGHSGWLVYLEILIWL